MADKKGLYENLLLEIDEIRVLALQPAADDEPIVCKMKVVHLRNKPIYEAVSYCWGTEISPEQIVVNGVRLQIHQNLHDALKVFRKERKGSERAIWADALCINQHNLQEKAQQVQNMGDIYENASHVLAWLGKEISEYEEWIQKNGFPSMTHYANDMRVGSDGLLTGLQTQLITELVPDFLRFLSLPYWTRTWIAQEYAVAQNVLLHWHDSCKMSAADLNTIYMANKKCAFQSRWGKGGSSKRDWEFDSYSAGLDNNPYVSIAKLADCYRSGSSNSIIFLASLLWRSSCTEPRDRIYGILKLAGYNPTASAIRVDYGITPAALWVKVLTVDGHQLREPMGLVQRLKAALCVTWDEITAAINIDFPDLWSSTMMCDLFTVKYEVSEETPIILGNYLAQYITIFFDDDSRTDRSFTWLLTTKTCVLKPSDHLYRFTTSMRLAHCDLYFAARPCVTGELKPLGCCLASKLVEEAQMDKIFARELATYARAVEKGLGNKCNLQLPREPEATRKADMNIIIPFEELFMIAEEQDTDHGSWVYVDL